MKYTEEIEAVPDNVPGIFEIQNTVNEYSTECSGYFDNLDDAIKALEECSDWWREKGTGRIYFVPFGLYWKQKKKSYLVYRK